MKEYKIEKKFFIKLPGDDYSYFKMEQKLTDKLQAQLNYRNYTGFINIILTDAFKKSIEKGLTETDIELLQGLFQTWRGGLEWQQQEKTNITRLTSFITATQENITYLVKVLNYCFKNELTVIIEQREVEIKKQISIDPRARKDWKGSLD